MLRARVAAALLFFGLIVPSVMGAIRDASAPDQVPAKEAWLKEFDEVCSKTQDAMTLAQVELTSLIKRCDALTPQIEKLDETRKKLYLGRLRMCRGLYAYVLDSKKNDSRNNDSNSNAKK